MYPNVTAAAALSNYTLGGWRRENPHQTTLKKGRDDSYTDPCYGWFGFMSGQDRVWAFQMGVIWLLSKVFFSFSHKFCHI